jgi:hypothetical protein
MLHQRDFHLGYPVVREVRFVDQNDLNSRGFSTVFRPTTTVAAENLFLRKQLGLFIERKAKPRRATDAMRFTLARLSRWFDWQATVGSWPNLRLLWNKAFCTSC